MSKKISRKIKRSKMLHRKAPVMSGSKSAGNSIQEILNKKLENVIYVDVKNDTVGISDIDVPIGQTKPILTEFGSARGYQSWRRLFVLSAGQFQTDISSPR